MHLSTFLRTRIVAALAGSALCLTGCGDDSTNIDTGIFDGGVDGSIDVGTDVDRDGGRDAEGDTDRDIGADVPDAGPNPTSVQIGAVRMMGAGGFDPALPVDDGIVTYVRAMIGTDPAGFFVQAEQTGPALFVAVDPSTLDPTPAVGDTVSFGVTEVMEVDGQLRVTQIIDFSRSMTGFDVSTLVQNLSSADNVVSNINDYESELVTVTGTIDSIGAFGGTAHTSYKFVTEGLDDELLAFRTPTVLIASESLGIGCVLTAGPAPLWRFEDRAQVSAFTAPELTDISCPAPTLRRALAPDDVRVRLRFSRPLDPATVSLSDITFTSPGAPLNALSVTVEEDSSVLTVTTNTQTDGLTYTATVTGVTDLRGMAIDPAMNSQMFAGSGPAPMPGAGDLLITEIFYDDGVAGPDVGFEWIEVFNPSMDTTYQLLGCEFDDIAGGGSDPLPIDESIRLAPGESLVLGGDMSETAADFEWGPGLNNDGDSVILRCAGVVVDVVDYDAAMFPMAAGSSIQLDPSVVSATVNDNGQAWCVASDSLNYGTMGFHGTPGMTNEACPGGNLLISEVVEGASSDKAVEVTNRGTAPVALGSCSLGLHSEGSVASTSRFTFASRTLLPGQSYVVCNPGISAGATCNETSSVINHNGNDAYDLSCDATVLDSFGVATGTPPGIFSGAGGLNGAEQTLLRQCDVVTGDTDLTDAFDLATEYESTTADPADSVGDFSNLGCDCSTCS